MFFSVAQSNLHSLFFLSSERWSVSKFGAWFCTRNRVQGGTPLQQVQNHDPHYLCQSKSLCYHDCSHCCLFICTCTINNNVALYLLCHSSPTLLLFLSLRCICISYFAVWRIFIPKASAIETSSHRISWWTQTQLYSNCVTLAGVCPDTFLKLTCVEETHIEDDRLIAMFFARG